MEDGIVVSVYCLAYNHEQYIRDALEGFVRQKTNFRYEVLVHDDASTDNTPAIIREYAQKYPDIIKPIFQTENQYSKGVKILPEIIHRSPPGDILHFVKATTTGAMRTSCSGRWIFWRHTKKATRPVCTTQKCWIAETAKHTSKIAPGRIGT